MSRNTTTTETQDPFQSGDFDAILDRSADEIREPGRCPSGPWVFRNVGFFIQKTSKEDLEENPDAPLGKVFLYHTPHEPLEGVDPDAVEAGEWRGRRITTRRNIKEAGDDFKVLELVKMHGVDPSGRTLRDALKACKGRLIRGSASVYSYTRKDTGETVVENQIKNFTSVEA